MRGDALDDGQGRRLRLSGKHLALTRVQDPKAAPHLGKSGTLTFHQSSTPPLRYRPDVKKPKSSIHLPKQLAIEPLHTSSINLSLHEYLLLFCKEEPLWNLMSLNTPSA